MAQVSDLRRFDRITDTPPPAPGFAGPGHTAVEVLAPDALATSDPFVLLMDDRIDLGPGPVGGPHPHAGLETATLIVDGWIRDRDEGLLRAGDALWMNAGRGIIHNESVEAPEPTRVLQLWIALPPGARDSEPGFQVIALDTLPIRREPGVEVRIYSGRSGGLRSPTPNHAPVTLVDIRLEAGAAVDQELPRSYGGFATS
jgi:redox-sensitive bicupin YhaK (pirin superfamily)